jgi:hypothetical protein
MALPNLINSTLVEIEKIDEDKTVYDHRRREPINRIARAQSFKVQAQIFWQEDQYVEPVQGRPSNRNLAGEILNSVGWIVVRKIDLQRIGKTLSRGDKIKSYGNSGKETQCEFFLVGKKDGGQYSDQGNTTLEKWFFEDRK